MFKDFLKEFSSTTTLRNVFSILVIATFLAIYEIVLFYINVAPLVKTQVDDGLKNAGGAVGKKLQNTVKLLLTDIKDTLLENENILQQNDKMNIDEIKNQYYKVVNKADYDSIPSEYKTNLLSGLDSKLQEYNDSNKKLGKFILDLSTTFKEREMELINTINGYTKATGVLIILVMFILMLWVKTTLNRRGENIGGCTWKISFITIAFIMAFQYVFYLYGLKYKYMGTMGQEELIYYLNNKL